MLFQSSGSFLGVLNLAVDCLVRSKQQQLEPRDPAMILVAQSARALLFRSGLSAQGDNARSLDPPAVAVVESPPPMQRATASESAAAEG